MAPSYFLYSHRLLYEDLGHAKLFLSGHKPPNFHLRTHRNSGY